MTENINQDRWVSSQEVCDYFCVKRHTVMRWVNQRDMPASNAGKLWRLEAADIDEWVKNDGTPVELEGIK